MQYFIGIVPPDEYKEKMMSFRNRWPNNQLKDVVEPHITVKAQGGLTADLHWLVNVRETCSSVQIFNLSLIEPGTFGDTVAFLTVKSEGIYDLHRRLVDAVSPTSDLIDHYFELDRYHPHLTLGQTYWGLNEMEIKEMKLSAMYELAPFPAFNVQYVRIYKEIEPNKYMPFEDIQLGR